MTRNVTAAPARAGLRGVFMLGAFVAGCLAVATAGGLITRTSLTTWYPTLAQPAFTPPGWAFPVVWTLLFLCMALAAWRIWRARGWAGARVPFLLFAAQLGFNLGWSTLFFGFQMIGAAAVETVALLALIVATAFAFWRIDRLAGALLMPYALWVAYAAVVTVAVWRLN